MGCKFRRKKKKTGLNIMNTNYQKTHRIKSIVIYFGIVIFTFIVNFYVFRDTTYPISGYFATYLSDNVSFLYIEETYDSFEDFFKISALGR